MRLPGCLKVLVEWDGRFDRYVYAKRDVAKLLGESSGVLSATLSRLVKAGVLVRAAHGVYVYAYSRHVAEANTVHLIARSLRRGCVTYESLESALSSYGVISQVPVGHTMYMTTGRSGAYDTPYGSIEFTHTKRGVGDILPGLKYPQGCALPLASRRMAVDDLRHVGRNLDLVREMEDADERES